jgi:hypothetical protein
MERPPLLRGRALGAIDGALALVALLLIVQMWLLTATLEAYLAGHHQAALPGAIVSGLLFAASFGLYVFVLRVDAEVKR